jgi:hypothetical protein
VSIPIAALDPEQEHREWVRSFEYHLDLLPPLMEVLVWMTIPGISASRMDQVKVAGGGEPYDIAALLATGATTEPLLDAVEIWGLVVEYVHAVNASISPKRAAPVLTRKPNPDPLLARSVALTTIGWLIDHAEQIAHLQDDEYREHMFAEIRRLRGRYGVFSTARRPKVRCTVCGEAKVSIVYVKAPNGSPKPVRVGRCATCGHTEGLPEPVAIPVQGRSVLSEVCADGQHDACESVNCECHCHDRTTHPHRSQ